MCATARDNSSSIPVNYELTISSDDAERGTTRILSRNGKKLEVKLPAGITSGKMLKLSNAQHLTDGHSGDILIKVIVKTPEKRESSSTNVQVVSDASFEQQVLNSSLPVVVDFWAPWCAPCHQLSPIIERLAEEYRGQVRFFKLDVDENPLASGKYQVQSIPLLLFFKDGKVIEQSRGAVPEDAVRSKLSSIL